MQRVLEIDAVLLLRGERQFEAQSRALVLERLRVGRALRELIVQSIQLVLELAIDLQHFFAHELELADSLLGFAALTNTIKYNAKLKLLELLTRLFICICTASEYTTTLLQLSSQVI